MRGFAPLKRVKRQEVACPAKGAGAGPWCATRCVIGSGEDARACPDAPLQGTRSSASPCRGALHNIPEAQFVILNGVRGVKNPGKNVHAITGTGILRCAQNDKCGVGPVMQKRSLHGKELEGRARESRAGTPAPPWEGSCTLTLPSPATKRAREPDKERASQDSDSVRRIQERNPERAFASLGAVS
jgi:hypothetical protein